MRSITSEDEARIIKGSLRGDTYREIARDCDVAIGQAVAHILGENQVTIQLDI